MKIIFPIFSIIGLGYLLRRAGIIGQESTHILNQFVYYISLPALVLISFWQIDWYHPETLATLGFNLFSILLFSGGLLVFVWFLRIKPEYKAALFTVSLVGNTIYMGFPIGQSVFGEEQFPEFVAAATPHLVLGIALAILVSEYFVIRAKKVKTYLKDFFLNPLILSLFCGILLSVFRVKPDLFSFVTATVEMLGSTASPVALVTLGAFLHGKFAKEHVGLSFLAISTKLAVFPLFIALAGKFIMPNTNGLSASFLAAAMPTAITVFVISEKYNIAPRFVAHTIVLTTLVSIATISITLFLI